MSSKSFHDLKRWRTEKLRLKQHEVAKPAGTNQGQIWKIEAGHLPNYWDLERYAKAYEVSVEEFIRLVNSSAAQRAARKDKRLEVVPTPAETITQELPLWKCMGADPDARSITAEDVLRRAALPKAVRA